MDIARHIRRRGFRHWYERELLRGHANLVLLVLSTLAVVGAIDAIGDAHGGDRLWMAGCAVAATGVAVHAMRRYLARMSRAEHLAHQAVCPSCRAYARWKLDPADLPVPEAEALPATLQAHCHDCGHRWRLML